MSFQAVTSSVAGAPPQGNGWGPFDNVAYNIKALASIYRMRKMKGDPAAAGLPPELSTVGWRATHTSTLDGTGDLEGETREVSQANPTGN